MKHRPRYLVTAGNTREMIDRVRDWGNIFTGNTGYDIARALADAGGEVDLVTSNRTHLAEVAAAPPRPHGVVRANGFTSHAELKSALAALMTRRTYDAVFMTAAVADYAPARVYEVLSRSPGEGGEETWTVRDAHAGKVSSS
jgi:phosphopantothenoylcysteine decarboxylase/phosphopantothenate--cysteine ligase